MPCYIKIKRSFLQGNRAKQTVFLPHPKNYALHLLRLVGGLFFFDMIITADYFLKNIPIGLDDLENALNLYESKQSLLWLYLYGFGFMALSLEPGFLDFDNLPDTNFSCVGKVIGGYYADLETNCQMFHVCTIGQLDEPMDIRFLCLNGTVFDQETRVCERIDEVDCTKSEQFYSLNLELYGHSQFSNLEENSETEQPLIIKSTLPTTTALPTTRKTTQPPFYTSVIPPTVTTLENRLSSSNQNRLSSVNHNRNNQVSSTTSHVPSGSKNHISSHHFPVINPSATDIRFNPEEINISLHPGAPPDIRTSYYSDKKVTNSENQLVVTTHRSVFDKSPREINIGSTFRDDDSGEYTEPPESYRIRTEFRPSQEYSVSAPYQQHYKSSTFRNDYTLSTPQQQQKSSTTLRNYFVQSLKPPTPDQRSQYATSYTEKSPERIQLILPQLPSLPTLTFSSPAPFSLQQRNEKRYTKDLLPPPRVVVSASASVSDASGKRLNFSLGTIGAPQLFKPPPSSYDEYKDEDVASDPFYLDVPKVTESPRKKRSADGGGRRNFAEIIKNDEEALDVLKFLFDWYKHEKTNPARYTTPLDAESISDINHQLAPEKEEEDDSLDLIFNTSNSFGKKSKYSLFGNDGSLVSHEEERKINKVHEKYTIEHEPDYVNDNYEPMTYKKEEVTSKYSDYIDDNIEPIYFKEREEYSSQETSKFDTESTPIPTFDTESTPIPTFDTESTPIPTFNTESNPIPTFNTESNPIPTFNTQSNPIPTFNTESTSIPTFNTESTSLPTFDIENTLTTDSIQTTPSYRKDKEKKTVEKPHRAKDDYDYLRTVKFFTSTTSPNSETTENDFIPTITETPFVTTTSVDPITQKNIVEVEKTVKEIDYTKYTATPFITTTEKSRKRDKSRRGRLKYGDFSNKETVGRKTSKQQEAQEPYSEILQSTTEVTNPTTTTMSTTEKETTTTWTKDLKKIIEDIESNTKSVVALKMFKQSFTEEESTTEEATTEKVPTTTELEDILKETTTTEDVSSTTNTPEVSTVTLEQFTSTEVPYLTETTSEITTTRKSRRGGKGNKKSGYRHRFGTDQFTRGARLRKPVVEEEIFEAISKTATSTVSSAKRKDFVLTDYPLRKSVNPTQSEKSIATTHSTMKQFFFNCFGKSIDKFYPDLRDCRLFHYCTQGYGKNQLLDLKFVCDLNTYFDDEKLICTKTKPERCL